MPNCEMGLTLPKFTETENWGDMNIAQKLRDGTLCHAAGEVQVQPLTVNSKPGAKLPT